MRKAKNAIGFVVPKVQAGKPPLEPLPISEAQQAFASKIRKRRIAYIRKHGVGKPGTRKPATDC